MVELGNSFANRNHHIVAVSESLHDNRSVVHQEGVDISVFHHGGACQYFHTGCYVRFFDLLKRGLHRHLQLETPVNRLKKVTIKVLHVGYSSAVFQFLQVLFTKRANCSVLGSVGSYVQLFEADKAAKALTMVRLRSKKHVGIVYRELLKTGFAQKPLGGKWTYIGIRFPISNMEGNIVSNASQSYRKGFS